MARPVRRPGGEKIQVSFQRMKLMLLTAAPSFLGLAVILTSKGPLTPLRLGVAAFFIGMTGLIVALRREAPSSLGSIKGKWAVVLGLVITAACWLAAAYSALFGLR